MVCFASFYTGLGTDLTYGAIRFFTNSFRNKKMKIEN